MSAMGDVAMSVPVLLALRQTYPELQITVLTRKFFEPILAPITGLLLFNAEVHGRHRGVFGLWKLFRELKLKHFDAVADLHNVLRSNLLKIGFKLNRIPFVQIDKGRAEKKMLTARHHKHFRQLKTTHQRYADVFEALGFALDLEAVPLLPKEPLTEKIRRLVNAEAKACIGIAPFAAYAGKQYPAKLMEEVLGILSNTDRYKIVLFGGGDSEKRQLEQWAAQYNNCVSAAAQLSLAEELVLISNLDLMVSMDSANGHLAANYGIPVITLWGLTHPFAGFYPFRQDAGNALLADRDRYPAIPTSVYGNRMPPGYEQVMETIAPSHVVAKITELLP